MRKYVPYETVGEYSFKKRIDGGEPFTDVLSDFVLSFLDEYARMNGTQTKKTLRQFMLQTDRIARTIAHNSRDGIVKTFKLPANWMQVFIAQTCIFGAENDVSDERDIEQNISVLWADLGWNVLESIVPMCDSNSKYHYFRINLDEVNTHDVKVILECYRELFDGDRVVSKAGKTYEVVAMNDDSEYILMDCDNGQARSFTALMMKNMEVLQ